MPENQIDRAVQKYTDFLCLLEKAVQNADCSALSSEQILDVLLARHAVQVALDKSTQPISKHLIKTLNELDNRLRKQFKNINYSTSLAKWRTHLNPPEEAWWWFLDSLVVPWSERYDWLWSFLSLAFLAASVSLAVDISSRFLSGGPDFIGTLAVIIQSVLTLLAGGSALTKSGQEGMERLLTNLKLPRHWWHEVSFVVSLFLFVALLSFHQVGLPLIADKYNYFGEKAYRVGQLASAEDNFSRSLQLSPDHSEAHYNLGQVYEALQDDRASAEYQLAVKGQFYKAYHRLARLYILKGKKDEDNYSKAVALLTEGLSQAEKQSKNDEETKYYTLTYMGWARLGQQRYSEAKPLLQDAIKINSTLTNKQALAHCLLGQVLEKQKDEKGAISMWEHCTGNASQTKPDEDAWLGVARQRSQKIGEK